MSSESRVRFRRVKPSRPFARSHVLAALGLTSFAVLAGTAACSGASEGDATHPVASADVPLPAASSASPLASASSASSAAPVVSASAKPANPPPKPVAAWTDPDTVAQLAQNCAWQPPRPSDAEMQEGRGNPMRCERIPPQSCSPDACMHTDETCYPECSHSCDACSTKCVSGCESCKKACKDDTCRATCATSCAACHQSCLKDLDHCTTGQCSEVENKCVKAEVAEFNATQCKTVCPKVSDCLDKNKCDSPMSPCADACVKKIMGPTCPAKWRDVCLGRAQSPDTYQVH